MKHPLALLLSLALTMPAARAESSLVSRVNPFLGSGPLTNVADIGFEPPWRVWAGLTFPGASRPNAMVQLSPITRFGSGAGYEYEHTVIHAFTHSNLGHWNLCHIPLLPVTGEVNPNDFGSAFSHAHESAQPGYYQVLLERYGINAELTTSRRCGYHRYTYPEGQTKKLVVNLAVANEPVRDWKLAQAGDYAFQGYQSANEKVFFHAIANHKIKRIETLHAAGHELAVIHFEERPGPLEIKVGLSFARADNARMNLEAELGGKSFEQVRAAATAEWETLLGKVKVTGGTARQQRLFYSCLYRSFLWPALRSDVNGEFLDAGDAIVHKDFSYYTIPALWDDYRNKLVLLGLLSPKVTEDVIQSLVDRGNCTGFMPTYFHGDHASVFITGSYLRGLRGFDVAGAYRLMLRNATVESPLARPYLDEYLARGYVSEPEVDDPHVETRGKAAVTKTLEYAYNDYAIGLLARELQDDATYQLMMRRAASFTNVFDRSTGLMRGRRPDGSWVKNFGPQFPYYEYMYREANAWQSSFFAPHDTPGLIRLYPSPDDFERQLDRLFATPWNPKLIARNVNSFIGQYCHGNQPDHGFPYLYYFVGKPEKSQVILDEIMERFYGMGGDDNTLCGMDDAGEMSSWYVFNAIGLYPYSPADADYLVTVPMFDTVQLKLGAKTLTIQKTGLGRKITGIHCDDRKVDGWLISHRELAKGKRLVISTKSDSP